MAGYSATPLAQKLGFRPPLTVLVVDAPPDYATWLGNLPAGLRLSSRGGATIQASHLFAGRRATLEARLPSLRARLRPDGFIWVSWPKKASKVATDVTEDVIREVALPLGLVDVKVCAINDVWSGLKLVVRRVHR